MSHDPFIEAVLATLRESPRYRLTAIIEMAKLSVADREKLKEHYDQCCWPLLQQEHFANLRDIGPWLFGARPGSDASGQYDFLWVLGRQAGNAVYGWLISAMPPEQLAKHLSHANVVAGTDGETCMLRYHTSPALRVLNARRDLPGVTDLLAPIYHWWVPVAHPKKTLWYRVLGHNRPDTIHPPTLVLDEDCWKALAGDPLSHRLAQILQNKKPIPALPENCHGTRLGLIDHYLDAAREQGLSRDDDLITHALMMAENGEELDRTPAWHEAVAAARDHQSSLSDAVETYLRRPEPRPPR